MKRVFERMSQVTRRLDPQFKMRLSSDHAAQFRATQLEAINDLAPWMMAANVVNMAIITALFWRTDISFVVGWSGLVLGIVSMWARGWMRSRGRRQRNTASTNALRRVTTHALIIGTVWAMPMIFLFRGASESERVVLATCVVGMVSGGALVLATVWRAALVFSGVIVVPAAVLLLATGDAVYIGLAALACSFAVIIASSVFERGRHFAAAFESALESREQSRVIGLLLKDFEDNASDWLIETDAHGGIVRPSPQFALMAGRASADLEGVAFADLLDARPGVADKAGARALARLDKAFRRRTAFRNIVVPVQVGCETRWWSLAGRPSLGAEARFEGFRGVGCDVTSARRAEASIRHLARYDSLTGLPNRNTFEMRTRKAVDLQAAFAVLNIDLDRFKSVNDTLGHQVGDLLLCAVTRRIVDALRKDDVAARFGGDEFVVLQHAATADDAESLAKRLVLAIGEPYEIEGQRVIVGASIGIALSPRDGSSSDELLRNSDLALYCAKRQGRNCHCFFSKNMDDEMQSRRLLELDLRDAIDRAQLSVHFQPLMDVETGLIVAFEALARWTHPTRGSISPAKFIPLAEETGLMLALGEKVLRMACAEAAGWTRDVAVAVNISIQQFRACDLVGIVRDVLAETGLPAARLELEITESLLINDNEDVLDKLSRLREMGVRISLDDFGTGYSSFAYLSRFPFDKLKIDQSFVRDVGNRPDSAAIVCAIARMASTLGIKTIAEGVENEAELAWLRQQGCREVQGHLFSAAVPPDHVPFLLGGQSRPDQGARRRDAA